MRNTDIDENRCVNIIMSPQSATPVYEGCRNRPIFDIDDEGAGIDERPAVRVSNDDGGRYGRLLRGRTFWLGETGGEESGEDGGER